MSDSQSTILVTGGAGFIGSAMVRHCLAEDGAAVITLDKLTYAGHRCSLAEVLDHPGHRFVEGDIADVELVTNLLDQHQPTAIVHMAAESHVDRSIATPAQFAETNALGTCQLLDTATHYWQGLDPAQQSAFRFLLISTDEVFGSSPLGEQFDEQSPLSPNSPYAASKAAAEHFAHAFFRTYGLPILIANPSNNYGPRQLPEKLIPKMILHAAAEKPLPVYGDGLHQRDWIHVDDCCRALLAILRCGQPGERYLIGAENCLPNIDIVRMICDRVDDFLADGRSRQKLIASVTDRLGHDRRYAVNAARLKKVSGWQPEIDFAEGLRETVRWYLDHPEWVEAVSYANGS